MTHPGPRMHIYISRRRPAWTDRILWLNAPSQAVRQLSYDSHPDILISDHKPVSSEFAIEVYMKPLLRYNYSTIPRSEVSIENNWFMSPVESFNLLKGLTKQIRTPVSSSTPTTWTLDKSRLWACLSFIFISHSSFSYGEKVERSFTLRNSEPIPIVFRLIPPEPGVPIGRLVSKWHLCH